MQVELEFGIDTERIYRICNLFQNLVILYISFNVQCVYVFKFSLSNDVF